jgi:hypothetical protein
MSSWCQYEALKYVSFPTQVLAKESIQISPRTNVIDFNCILHRVAEPEPEPEPEPVGTVFIWGIWNRNRNRIRNTVPVPGTRKLSKKLRKIY